MTKVAGKQLTWWAYVWFAWIFTGIAIVVWIAVTRKLGADDTVPFLWLSGHGVFGVLLELAAEVARRRAKTWRIRTLSQVMMALTQTRKWGGLVFVGTTLLMVGAEIMYIGWQVYPPLAFLVAVGYTTWLFKHWIEEAQR